MYLVFRTVHTQLLCIVDCRIGTVQQRPALLPNHIGNLSEACAKFFLLLRQRFRFEPLHVLWPRIMEHQIDQKAKRMRLCACLLQMKGRLQEPLVVFQHLVIVVIKRKLRLIAAQHPRIFSAPNAHTVLLDTKQLRVVDNDQRVKFAGHCAKPPQKIHICIHMLCIVAGNACTDNRSAPAKPAAFQIRSIFRQHLKFCIRNFGNFRAVAVMDSLLDRRIGMPHYPVAHQAVSAPLLRRYPRGLHRLFLARAAAFPTFGSLSEFCICASKLRKVFALIVSWQPSAYVSPLRPLYQAKWHLKSTFHTEVFLFLLSCCYILFNTLL